MQNKSTIEEIKEILATYTAEEYAEKLLAEEKENPLLCQYDGHTGEIKTIPCSYQEYMKESWSGEENPKLEDCIERSRKSKIEVYHKLKEVYNGFFENYEYYALNLKEKYISVEYKRTETKNNDETFFFVHLFTDYNPLNVDCISQIINYHNYINDEFYLISKDRDELIKKCNQLIKSSL